MLAYFILGFFSLLTQVFALKELSGLLTAHEAALLEYITSANIACGGHAGDAFLALLRLCLENKKNPPWE